MTATITGAYRAERSSQSATNGHRPRRPRTPVLVHVGRFAARAVHRWHAIRTVVLAVAALCLATAAAWIQFGLAAGLAAGALSLLVLEVLSSEERR